MKKVEEVSDEEQQSPEKNRRSVKYDTFKKWQSNIDAEMQTLTWLDLNCVAELSSKNQIVKQLNCKICSKYQDRITGI